MSYSMIDHILDELVNCRKPVDGGKEITQSLIDVLEESYADDVACSELASRLRHVLENFGY